jgi:hypothetical protein
LRIEHLAAPKAKGAHDEARQQPAQQFPAPGTAPFGAFAAMLP